MSDPIFFILLGLINGQQGKLAFVDWEGVYSDGWYFLDKEGETNGAFPSREEAELEYTKSILC